MPHTSESVLPKPVRAQQPGHSFSDLTSDLCSLSFSEDTFEKDSTKLCILRDLKKNANYL